MRILIATAALVAVAGCGAGDDDTVDTGGLTSAEVAESFVAAGLPAERIAPLPPDDPGMAYTDDGTRFVIPSLAKDEGGRTFVIADPTDLRELQSYYDGFSCLLHTWAFANADCGVLVQINGELTEQKASEYERVVQDICSVHEQGSE